jgi:hypothetical protein
MLGFGMTDRPAAPVGALTTPERDLIRRALGLQFRRYPPVADGLVLRLSRGGPLAGQPKLPPAVQTMVARGWVEVRMEQRMPRAFFTDWRRCGSWPWTAALWTQSATRMSGASLAWSPTSKHP